MVTGLTTVTSRENFSTGLSIISHPSILWLLDNIAAFTKCSVCEISSCPIARDNHFLVRTTNY
jgi:hypothetical protein